MKRLTYLFGFALAGLFLTALAVGALDRSLALHSPTSSNSGAAGGNAPTHVPTTSLAPLGVIETDGTLDSAFDAGNFTNGLVVASAYQSDSKLLIAGQFSKVHGVARGGIARLNTDGTLDLSFDPGAGAEVGVGAVIPQQDGKIIVCEFFNSFNGVEGLAALARLNGDGSVDSSFNAGRHISLDGSDDGQGNAISPGYVYAAALQLDGKIVVTGNFFYVITGPGTNVARSCVARFNSDGTLDSTFDPGAGAVSSLGTYNTFVFYAANQNTKPNAGKIIIEGSFDLFDNHPVSGMARLNTDGSFDSTFDPGTATNGFVVSGLVVQSDDKPLVFGSFDSFNGVACSDIVRLTSSGSVDSGFSTAEFKWYANEATIWAVAEQANGQLIVGGDFHALGGATANNVVRLETNGARDTSFSATGTGPSAESVNTVTVRPSDGKIFLGGEFATYGNETRNNIALANPDGSIDNSFAGLAGVVDYNPNVWAMAIQPDGKILLTGLFTSFNGTPHYNVLRLNPNATIDSSFNVETDRSTRAVILQPDGKIVIGGNFGEVNGVARNRIARLNSDGTLDLSFDSGTGPNQYIRGLAQDSAENIYAGGEFSVFNGMPYLGVVKLSSTGAVDPQFNPNGGGADDPPSVWTLTAPDADGHIVIAGGFSLYNEISARRIARIDAKTGAIDPTFHTGSGFTGYVYALREASDAKYYVGGSFSAYNGISRNRIARLNSDGSLDDTFVGPALTGTVYSLALQNGKVYAGGGDYPAGVMVRLTSSGALDSSFNTGTNFDIVPEYTYGQFTTKISALAIQDDGKLLVGGIFNQYNGTARTCLARLTGPVTPPPPTPTPTPTPTPSPSPTPAAQALNLSTRLVVGTGNNVGIAGFIITGTTPMQLLMRGIGHSLGIPNSLADPVIELHGPNIETIVCDNWQDCPGAAMLCKTGFCPTDPLEADMLLPLDPGAYTLILRGNGTGIGVGLTELYDLSTGADSRLANISTRAFVNTGNDIVIAGFILGSGTGDAKTVVRGLGPSLGLSSVLANPMLELRDSNGTTIAMNDDWQDDSAQAAMLTKLGLAPTNNLESGLVTTLQPGAYTALLSGVNEGTGIGLVEVYDNPSR